jgi:hypothetical protein
VYIYMCEVQFLFSSIIFVNQVGCIILSIAVAIDIVNIVSFIIIKHTSTIIP